MAESLLDKDDSLQLDSNKAYLEQLVGEGKKFKTAEDLARGKAESDSFIEIMKARMDELRSDHLRLREEHQASAQLKDLIDNLQKSKDSDNTRDTTRDNVITPAIKPEDIENLVNQQLNKHQLAQKQESNFRAVQAKLKEKLGEDYSSTYKQRMDDLGLTKEFADDLAKNHPSVFYKTFGLDDVQRQNSFQAPPRSNQRQDNFAPKVERRTYAWYQQQNKMDPRAYLDPKISLQMHDDLMEMGPELFWGDTKP